MGFKKFIDDIFSTPGEDETDQSVSAAEQTEDREIPAAEPKAEKAAEKPTRRTASQTGAQAQARTLPGANALELRICKPQSFAEVGTIADHLLNRCTVVLNLETTSKETARRIVDFLNGVAYSIDGQIKPVANNTFVLTPKSVSVTGEETEEIPEEEPAEDSSFDNF